MPEPPALSGMAEFSLLAKRLKGMDCNQTLPGPITVAKNIPWPLNRVLVMPPTYCTS